MESILSRFFVPSIMALIFIIVLLIIRAVAFRFIARWAERTATTIDDVIVTSLTGPTIFWVIALGIFLGVQFSDLEEKHVFYISRIIKVILVFSVTIAAANLSGRVFKKFIQQSQFPLPTTGLAYGLLKGIILLVGLLFILGILGISIAPLITALGIGGLAVALALQDTLANLFAGVHVLVEKSIRVGDFIRLESGQEGYVDDITWRTTRVRMLPNNMVVIPNSKLAQSVVTNYDLPEKRMSVVIPVSVSYSSDPDQVEKILVEEAQKAADEVPGLLRDPAPSARFIPGFGENSLDFSLVFQVREFVDQYPAQHEIRKRIFKRFKEEGIEIPFPQRTIHVERKRTGTPDGSGK